LIGILQLSQKGRNLSSAIIKLKKAGKPCLSSFRLAAVFSVTFFMGVKVLGFASYFALQVGQHFKPFIGPGVLIEDRIETFRSQPGI
jgi:hypothetical protein